MMSLGKGAVASYSRKHKLNTKSSTEPEIIGVDQVMPEVCWTYNFLEAQGYSIDYSEIFQDNISAQMLEINGKLSSTKRTKHTKAKFFFVKDKVDKGGGEDHRLPARSDVGCCEQQAPTRYAVQSHEG